MKRKPKKAWAARAEIGYQVIHSGGFGWTYKPVRVLALPDGALVSLMHSFNDDGTWIIFSLDSRGVIARSRVFKMKSVSEVMWRELCDELTFEYKKTLADTVRDRNQPASGRWQALQECVRLDLADDDEYDGTVEKVRQSCAMHTEDEIRDRCQSLWDRYLERQENCGEEES